MTLRAPREDHLPRLSSYRFGQLARGRRENSKITSGARQQKKKLRGTPLREASATMSHGNFAAPRPPSNQRHKKAGEYGLPTTPAQFLKAATIPVRLLALRPRKHRTSFDGQLGESKLPLARALRLHWSRRPADFCLERRTSDCGSPQIAPTMRTFVCHSGSCYGRTNTGQARAAGRRGPGIPGWRTQSRIAGRTRPDPLRHASFERMAFVVKISFREGP